MNASTFRWKAKTEKNTPEYVSYHKAKKAYAKIKKMKKIRTKKYVELEKNISECPFYSLSYAKSVLHGRFEIGEESIGRNLKICYLYARHVILGELPENLHCIMMANAIMGNIWARAYFNYLTHIENKK